MKVDYELPAVVEMVLKGLTLHSVLCGISILVKKQQGP